MRKEVLVPEGRYLCANNMRIMIAHEDIYEREEAINAYLLALLSTFDCFKNNDCPPECPIKVLSKDLKTKLSNTKI